jgi:hypothetical protein
LKVLFTAGKSLIVIDSLGPDSHVYCWITTWSSVRFRPVERWLTNAASLLSKIKNPGLLRRYPTVIGVQKWQAFGGNSSICGVSNGTVIESLCGMQRGLGADVVFWQRSGLPETLPEQFCISLLG